MVNRIAKETPETEPGREQLYHYLSFGWLCGGIIEIMHSGGTTFIWEEISRCARRSNHSPTQHQRRAICWHSSWWMLHVGGLELHISDSSIWMMEYAKMLKFQGGVEHISLMKPKIYIFSIIVIVIVID